MHSKFIKKIFLYNTLIFILFGLIFLFYPSADIYFSSFFFNENQFISEKYTIIKVFRVYLKNLMIIIPVISLLILFINVINKKQNMKRLINQRNKFALITGTIGHYGNDLVDLAINKRYQYIVSKNNEFIYYV